MIPFFARRRALWAVVSGAVLAFALPTVFPIVGTREIQSLPGGWLAQLALLALIPLILALSDASPRACFGYGWLAGVAYFSVAIWWIHVAMHTFGGIPTFLTVPILALLIGYISLYWGLAFLADRKIRAGFPGLPQWLTLPMAFTGAEIVRNYLFSGFPWANLGYLLVGEPTLAQSASLFGVYGLCFLLVLISVVGSMFFLPFNRWGRWEVIPAFLIFGALGYGELRQAALRSPSIDHGARSLKVAILQGNIDQKIKNAAKGGQMGFGEYRRFVLDRYLPLSRQADAAGADLIVWPEASFPGQLPLHPTEFPDLLGPPFRAELLIGGVTLGRVGDRITLTNSAFAVESDRQVVGEYDKHHLVPFGEYVPLEKTLHLPIHKVIPDVGFFDPGESLNVLTSPSAQGEARFGPMICFDAIFPEIGVDLARQHPDFLVNITNDAWYGFSSASYQFLSMVALRAIETGKPIVRAANTGISAYILPDGTVAQHLPIGLVASDDTDLSVDKAVPPQMLMVDVPLGAFRHPTLYVTIGDSFAWACVLITGALWFALWIRAKKGKKALAHAPRRAA